MNAIRQPRARTGRPAVAPAGPNLARRPFVNRRPVSRIALLLVVAGAVLLLVDLWLYVGYARARQANATQLHALEASIQERRAALEAAERELVASDVEQQNEMVAFMNRRIAERTFGWSVLFDRLADLLPRDVRLENLSPTFVDPDEDRRPGAAARAAGEPRRVSLSLIGQARDGEAILELVDALFADPAFEAPNLSQEARDQGQVKFTLTVTYLPEVAQALAAEAARMDAPVEETGAPGPGEERSDGEAGTAAAPAPGGEA